MKPAKKYLAVLMAISILLCSVIAITSSAADSSQGDNEVEIEELQPVMASQCYSDIYRGKPEIPNGCVIVRNDVRSVNSSYFIGFVEETFGTYHSNQWKYHMETWEDDDGNTYECHYWQGPQGVTYYHG